MTETRYPAVLRYISETPWAMLPSTLLALREIISRRVVDGVRLSDEDLAEISARAPKRSSVQPAAGAVAVLPLWGVLSPHQVSDISSGPTTALDSWGAMFDEVANDQSVAAIILDIDSPGGAVDLVPETAAKIRAAAAKKPVIAVANTRAASAAYWLAAQASELVVSPSGAVGSVGVYAAHEDISAQLAAEGVKVTLISAGDHKTDGNPFEPLSEEARASIQSSVDAYYSMFVGDVAKGRGVNAQTVFDSFGQGTMVRAADAVKAGMADSVGTLEQTIARLVAGQQNKSRRPAARAAALEPAVALAAGGISGGSITVNLDGFARMGARELGEQISTLLLASEHEQAADALPDTESEPAGGVVPVKHTTVVDVTWDGPGEVAKLTSPITKARGFGMYAWYDPDGDDEDDDGYPDAKTDWKFEHHQVVGGEPADAVVSACRNGLARLTDADIPEADKAGVRAHLQAHIDDFTKNSGVASASAGNAAAGGEPPTPSRRDATMDSIEELVARRDEITQRMTEIDAQAAGRALDTEEQVEFDGLTAELAQIDATVSNINSRRQRLADIVAVSPESNIRTVEIRKPQHDRGGIHTNVDSRLPENVFDLGAYRGVARSLDDLAGLQCDGARKIAEGLHFSVGDNGDEKRAHEHVERVLLSERNSEDRMFARRTIMTANPAYERAFLKAVARGRDSLTSQEDQLIKAAISDSGLGSETPVPVTIDPTVMLTSNGTTNPLRAVGNIHTITGYKWRGIGSDGVTMTYAAELTEASDGSPTYHAPDLTVQKAQGLAAFSIEVDEDWPSLREQLAEAFTDAKDVLEGTKFFTGSGTNEPQGLITALTASTSPVVVIKTATTATFAVTDPKLAANDLAPRWDAGAQWFAAKAVWADIEDLLAALGNADPFSWVGNGGIPTRPLGNTGLTYRGYPMNNASVMDTAVATSGKNIMVIGDPRAFDIVDRIGMNVELIPHLFNTANNLPDGRRGLYVYFRNTSAVRTVKAFRVLQVK